MSASSSVVKFTSTHYPEVSVVLYKPTSARKQAILVDSAKANRMIKEAAVRYTMAERQTADKQDIAVLLSSQDEFKTGAGEIVPVYIKHMVKSIKGLVMTDEDGNEEVIDRVEDIHTKAPDVLTDEILNHIKTIIDMKPSELKNLLLLTTSPARVLGSEQISSASTGSDQGATAVEIAVSTPQS